MASSQIVCLLLFVTLAAARTLNLEKIALSLTEDSKESDSAVTEILNSFLSYHGHTPGDLELELRDCSNGTCTLCTKKFKICFVASVEAASIKVKVTIAGTSFFETTISFSGDKTFCKKIDFIPDVEEVCVVFTDIDLKEMSGCVSVSVKTKIPIPIKLKIGCFKIPHSDDQVTGNDEFRQGNQNEATDDVRDESVLKFVPFVKHP